MPFRKESVLVRKFTHQSRLVQGALLMAFWGLGEIMSSSAQLPVPGGVIGLIIVLALLASGRLSTLSVRRGANWLLGDMLLFFVPAVLAVLDHQEFLGIMGLKLLAAVLVGTMMVMAGTALTVDLCCRMSRRHAE
ncbi:CidA/LrgA family protein [Desulfobaculum bizertense]|uniref:Holin-like protein n=1 Tax=Desulfobaculum bizertense DSM 18034 TaxID=1121442 RepID=A0A1T4WBU9_9BACT|nr:CidA/LrgA family protein [Desulfobaculum bizertense]UIJ37491.1 CidA/LrgA family protein [Desulfobaculum bizertense]SKA74667.1 holin-like protein [Desulfobaculum bizertense DSM 18034]